MPMRAPVTATYGKGYVKLADSLHLKKHILVPVVTCTSITTDGRELLHSIFNKMQRQTAFSRVVFEHLFKILAFKIRNPNSANPKPKLLVLSIVKLLILADVPGRLRDNYVGITLLKLNSTH